jgi:hypothetical protein
MSVSEISAHDVHMIACMALIILAGVVAVAIAGVAGLIWRAHQRTKRGPTEKWVAKTLDDEGAGY